MDFAAFAARKEAEARSASLSPLITESAAPGAESIPVGNAWTRRWFDGDFYVSPPRGALPSTSLVFVQSRDGNTVAANPATLGGGEVDKHVIYEGLSRVAADAVLAGAQTVRDGKIVLSVWHPELVALRASLGLARHPIQMVATLRGLPFADSLLFNVPELRVILLTTAAWIALMHYELRQRPWITPVAIQAPGDLTSAFKRVRENGLARISCIGGRTLARELLREGLVDDLYLTTSARGGGEPNTPLVDTPVGGELVVRKHGTGPDEGMIFEHTRLR